MFYSLHTIWQLTFLAAGLGAFAVVSWRWPRYGGALVVFLAPLYLLKINGLPVTVLEALMWLFVLVWLAAKIKGRQGARPQEIFSGYSRGFWWALVLILAGTFLASVFSPDWRVSFGVFKAYFIAPLIFSFVLAEVFKGGGFKNIFLALFSSAVAVAIISLVYLVLSRFTFDGRLAAFYLSPNHLAMWLAGGIIAGGGLWLEANKVWQKVFLSLVSCLLFLVLYFTYSYGAWLGLAAAVVFAAVYLWKIRRINGRQLLMAVVFLSAVGLVLVALQFNGGGKLAELFSSPRSSWQSRLMIWQSAILILKEHWLLGVGPGLFQKYYLAYQQYFSVPYLEWAVPQPHNLFLAWWLQAGLVGVIGFIWVLAIFFKQTMLTVKHHLAPTLSSTEERGENEGRTFLHKIKPPLIIILMAVTVYFLVHGLADTTFWKNDLALIFWLIVFLGSTEARRAD